jgi:hypothetical protein
MDRAVSSRGGWILGLRRRRVFLSDIARDERDAAAGRHADSDPLLAG